MTTTTLAVILIGAFILLLIYWLVRSRGNTTGHIDTTLTALGAATEAVEDIVDAVRPKAGTPPPAETPPPTPAPVAEEAKAPPVKAAPAKAAPAKTPKSEPKAEKAAAKPAVSAAEKTPKKAPAAKPAATPAAEKAPKKPAAQPDNLRQIKGVGPKLATQLTELGVTRFDQIAAWKPADVEKIDAQLGTFKGRPTRDNWVEQASLLAKGDIAGFEAKFGKLDG